MRGLDTTYSAAREGPRPVDRLLRPFARRRFYLAQVGVFARSKHGDG